MFEQISDLEDVNVEIGTIQDVLQMILERLDGEYTPEQSHSYNNASLRLCISAVRMVMDKLHTVSTQQEEATEALFEIYKEGKQTCMN